MKINMYVYVTKFPQMTTLQVIENITSLPFDP